MKPKKHLGFSGMRTMLSSCFNKIPEHRQSNKITYSAHDALMSGFACMHVQDPSLLQFQKRLEKKHHKSNLQTLFDIKSIPESTQLRTIIDCEITLQWRSYIGGHVASAPLPTLRPSIFQVIFCAKISVV